MNTIPDVELIEHLDYAHDVPCEALTGCGTPAEYILTLRCIQCHNRGHVFTCGPDYRTGMTSSRFTYRCGKCGVQQPVRESLIERRCIR